MQKMITKSIVEMVSRKQVLENYILADTPNRKRKRPLQSLRKRKRKKDHTEIDSHEGYILVDTPKRSGPRTVTTTFRATPATTAAVPSTADPECLTFFLSGATETFAPQNKREYEASVDACIESLRNVNLNTENLNTEFECTATPATIASPADTVLHYIFCVMVYPLLKCFAQICPWTLARILPTIASVVSHLFCMMVHPLCKCFTQFCLWTLARILPTTASVVSYLFCMMIYPLCKCLVVFFLWTLVRSLCYWIRSFLVLTFGKWTPLHSFLCVIVGASWLVWWAPMLSIILLPCCLLVTTSY